MNAVPAHERGAASGIRATGMNAGMVLSMGGFFTLMAIGWPVGSGLDVQRLTKLGSRRTRPRQISHTPPVGTLFARLPRDNPIKAAGVSGRPAATATGFRRRRDTLTGKTFFPHLISEPFRHGLAIAFGVPS